MERSGREKLLRARLGAGAALTATLWCWCAPPGWSDAPKHDYPTAARVEFVQECMRRNGGALAALYQCSCVIDRFADHLTYDEFLEASTFARYATLPGQVGGIFRDPDVAKERLKLYRQLEAEAYRACGLRSP